jgi:hypothetical protein
MALCGQVRRFQGVMSVHFVLGIGVYDSPCTASMATIERKALMFQDG